MYQGKEKRTMNEINAVSQSEIQGLFSAGDIIDSYINQLSKKQRTVDTYRKALKRFKQFILSSTGTIADIGKAEIIAYKNYLEKLKLKPSTIGLYITAVKGFFRWAESEKIYPDIAKDVSGVKFKRSHSKEALDTMQAKRLLASMERETIEGKRDFAIVNLLMRTGLRTIEAQRALIEDISVKDGQTILYIQGKGRDYKDDFVVLTPATLDPLKDYLNLRGETDSKMPLFVSHGNRSKGQPLNVGSISRIIKTALRASGMDNAKYTAHSLRHTACTLAIKAGVNIVDVQKFARHSNINTTMIYIHDINRIENAPEIKIDNFLAAL